METEIRIDEGYSKPKAVIFTAEITDEVNDAVKRLSAHTAKVLTGFRENMMTVLEPADIVRIYSAGGKVYAVSQEGEFILRQRLYELEEMLAGTDLVRISNSELVNLKKVKGFDLSLAGTICVKMKDGSVTYVSRRFVAKIKKILGL